MSVDVLMTEAAATPYVKKRISPALRERVWRYYIGDEILGSCFCCHRELARRQPDWHCGHVLAEACGGETTLANLRPVCQHCNWSMRTKHMFTWMNEKGFQVPMEI